MKKLRNPVAKGTQMVKTSTQIGVGQVQYRISHKVDYPLVGDPQHFLEVVGETLLPDDVALQLKELDLNMFIWFDRSGVEYFFDCLHHDGNPFLYEKTYRRIVDILSNAELNGDI